MFVPDSSVHKRKILDPTPGTVLKPPDFLFSPHSRNLDVGTVPVYDLLFILHPSKDPASCGRTGFVVWG